MASNPNKWELVGKGGKTRKNNEGNKKNKAKVNEADLPKLDIRAPIPESKTQFDAFTTKEPEKVPFAVPKQESDTDSDNQNDFHNEVNRIRIEKKRKHHKEPAQSLDVIVTEALKKCDMISMRIFISECKSNYPNNGLVLLKEITGFLQEKFEALPVEKDPVLGQESSEFPLCCLADDAQDRITDEVTQCNKDDINKFFSYCLDELLIEINRGRATYGIRIMIQCILKCHPYVTMRNKREYLQRVVSRRDNSREALSLLWTLGQTSDHDDLEERIAVWSSFFLPVVESKHLSKCVVEYLELTLRLQMPDKFKEARISGKDFQHILEITCGSNSCQFSSQGQLQSLYPKLKAIVFNSRPSNSQLTDVFTHLFDSLNNDFGSNYLQEALICLIGCLQRDEECHDKWRNNYLARLKESSLLLKAIIRQWESFGRLIPRKYLLKTLHEFQNANELKEREKPKTGLLDCEASCEVILGMISTTPASNAKAGPSRIAQMFKLLLFLLFITVCVDMYKNNGYQGSKTAKVLQQSCIEDALVYTYGYSKLYAQRMESWLETRYPHYYKKVRDVVEPASDYAITKLGEGLHYIANVTAPVREYIHKTVPPLLEKFEDFMTYYFNRISNILIALWQAYFPVVKQYSQRAWDAFATWVPFAWARAKDLTRKTGLWIYNLYPDFFHAIDDGFRRLMTEVVTRAPHILALVQEYLLTAWKLLVSGLSDAVLWIRKSVSY